MMNINKLISTNRQRFSSHRNQQFVSQQLRIEKKSSQKYKDLLIPIDNISKKHQWMGKPLRSEGKSVEKQTKIPALQVFNFKESLLLKKSKDSFNLKHLTQKKSNSNRMVTEKIQLGGLKMAPPSYSVQKKNSVNKILIRGGAYPKEPASSSSRVNPRKYDIDIIYKTDKGPEPEGPFFRESPRKSLQKKLTAFQRSESKQFQVLFIGNRRINSISDFTDNEGDSKISIGDAIAYKYEVLSFLGRGSFGKVVRALDHKKKEEVAIKVIKNQQKFTVQARVQIQILETALMNDPKLRNNIVRLKGSFIFRGHTCLKFQILSKNLYEFIRETNFSGFSEDLIRRFAIQILQALHFFFKLKIIHCDLKPENILLKQQNKSGIKIIDVGSGCFQGKQIYTYIQSRFYRAPQIILGVKYSTAIDMWSFGCILVQLYTGIPLFPGQNQNEQMLMLIELLGLPPKTVLQKAERRKKFFTDDFTCKIPPQKNKQKIKQAMSWKNILGSDCDKSFLDLVKRCLEWNPSLRITPREALLHEWVIAGLPHTIRSQHVQQLQNE